MSSQPVNPQQSFPALEEQVLARWQARDVFAESLRRRSGAERWVFWEGPPTANGRPGSHHVLSRVFKDIFPRYKTMRGYYVERKGGWDCHGLPVEIAVEKELGISSKEEIEAYGIAKFNQKCRESVFTFLKEWNQLTDRIGFWLNLEDAYRTLDAEYVESVWWAVAEIAKKDLLYEGHKVVPYCPRCGTALSSHEVALGYKDVIDQAAFVALSVLPDTASRDAGWHGKVQAGDQLIIWTTTPWTLVSNAAVAVHSETTYVRARPADSDQVYILARDLLDDVLGEGSDILAAFPGVDLEGLSYEPPFSYIATAEYGEFGHKVLLGDFVTATDGTGVVHTAVAFGEDDFQLGKKYDLNVINPVRQDGTYDEQIGEFSGRFVKDPALDLELVDVLKAQGKLFRTNEYRHSYPHCWRCSTPLIYYAKPSWYIETSKLRDRFLAANNDVHWHPEHIQHGRFGVWLENNVDWALSRERYWGTPLPVWRCENNHIHVIGSFQELETLSGCTLDDPHRPHVDEVVFPCQECDSLMWRVPEVIDVWFDSGSMPFAQHHAPHLSDGQKRFEQEYPANFICEAIDQTRGWFYSLLAISVLLYDRAPYENVVCLGLILDNEGQKMSKSKGNVVEPWTVIDKYGADAFRWYFFTSKQPWDGYRFSLEAIGEGVRIFLRQLWNTYSFYDLYTKANGLEKDQIFDVNHVAGEQHQELDLWIRSRLASVVQTVTKSLDDYDATTGGRAIAGFVDDLSNWYVRRSRRRFWDGELAAFATLHECLVTVAKLLAPFTPFIADEIYEGVDGREPSVHLCDWPQAQKIDNELEAAMATARETVRLGLAARAAAKVKIRQPLGEAAIVATGEDRKSIERFVHTICEELNVKTLRFVAAADELGAHELKPNYRTLGPRFGKDMAEVRCAIEALDAATAVATLRHGDKLTVTINGENYELLSEDFLFSLKPIDGYQLEREGSHAVALNLELTDTLMQEGFAREIIHAVQVTRKKAGLAVEDRIALVLGGSDELLVAARSHNDHLMTETLAIRLEYLDERERLTTAPTSEQTFGETLEIEGKTLKIGLTRVGSQDVLYHS